MSVELSFPERAVYFRTGLGMLGSGYCDSIAPRLLELARRASTSDSVVQRYVLPEANWGKTFRTDIPEGQRTFIEKLPAVMKKAAPKYPIEARRDGIEGTVMVLALVGRDGSVEEVRIKHSIPVLDAAALEAVRRWKFTPAMTAGKPVAVWVGVPVKFTLH